MNTTIVLIIVILIIIIIVGIIVYFEVIRKKGGNSGETCSKDSDCKSKYYCGGDGTCHEGTAVLQGGSCKDTSSCEIGLTCISNTCQTNSPSNNISSFSKMYLTSAIGNTTYYLNLVAGVDQDGNLNNSLWLVTKPGHTFSYSSNTNTLSVEGDINRTVMTQDVGALHEGPAVKLFFRKVSESSQQNQAVLLDDYNNVFQSASTTPILAFFNDPSIYNSISLDQQSQAVIITLIPSTSEILPDRIKTLL